MAKPRVFIGSSTESLEVAKAIELQLVRKCATQTWDSGTFRLSHGTLDDLERAANRHDFAVLVLSPDDLTTSRGKEYYTARDNVLFELGLFVGKLGKKRTFVVTDPKKIKIPSDWFGVTVAAVEWSRIADPADTLAAVSPACTQILDCIRQSPPLLDCSVPEATSTVELAGLDEVYAAIADAHCEQGPVVVANEDTAWAWNLFPTILEWRLSALPVTVYATPPRGPEKHVRQERYRRNLLEQMGVRLIVRKSLNVRGFFQGIGERSLFTAIVLKGGRDGYSPLGLRYDADVHDVAAEALLDRIGSSWKSTRTGSPFSLRRQKDSAVCKILRENVRQYSAPSVKIRADTVSTKELKVISRFTRRYRYCQVERLVRRYRQIRVDPFKALRVQLRDNSWSMVTPPVVESGPHGLVVIEGNTRATFAFREGMDDFPCLLVEGCTEPLPGHPVSVSEVKVSSQTRIPTDRIEGFNYGRFRHIERAVHPY